MNTSAISSHQPSVTAAAGAIALGACTRATGTASASVSTNPAASQMASDTRSRRLVRRRAYAFA